MTLEHWISLEGMLAAFKVARRPSKGQCNTTDVPVWVLMEAFYLSLSLSPLFGWC